MTSRILVLFTELLKSYTEVSKLAGTTGKEKDKEFSFGHLEVEMPIVQGLMHEFGREVWSEI